MSMQNWTNEQLIYRLVHNKTDRNYWKQIRVLRSRPDKSTYTQSVKLARSRDVEESVIGIRVLSQLGLVKRPFARQTEKLFFILLHKAKHPDVIANLLYGIYHLGNGLTVTKVKTVSAFARHPDPNVREGLAFLLAGVHTRLATDIQIMLSADRIAAVRNWATFGLGTNREHVDERITAVLWQRIKDKNATVRYEAMEGLATHKVAGIREFVIQHLQDENAGSLVFGVVDSLGADPLLLPPLKKLLKAAEQDNTINPDWLGRLKTCIRDLKSRLKDLSSIS